MPRPQLKILVRQNSGYTERRKGDLPFIAVISLILLGERESTIQQSGNLIDRGDPKQVPVFDSTPRNSRIGSKRLKIIPGRSKLDKR